MSTAYAKPILPGESSSSERETRGDAETRAWMESAARAYLDAEEGQLRRDLDRWLDGLAASGRTRRAAAYAEMAVLLREHLDPWRHELVFELNERRRRTARERGRDPDALEPLESRVPCLTALPSVFLDPAAAARRLRDALDSAGAWRRVRRDVHVDARVLLRANVRRILDELVDPRERA